jgi:hypothetical protein
MASGTSLLGDRRQAALQPHRQGACPIVGKLSDDIEHLGALQRRLSFLAGDDRFQHPPAELLLARPFALAARPGRYRKSRAQNGVAIFGNVGGGIDRPERLAATLLPGMAPSQASACSRIAM